MRLSLNSKRPNQNQTNLLFFRFLFSKERSSARPNCWGTFHEQPLEDSSLFFFFFFFCKVAAQTGHRATVVDVSDEVLQKSHSRIQESVRRVAKKKFADKPEVSVLLQSVRLLKYVRLAL